MTMSMYHPIDYYHTIITHSTHESEGYYTLLDTYERQTLQGLFALLISAFNFLMIFRFSGKVLHQIKNLTKIQGL